MLVSYRWISEITGVTAPPEEEAEEELLEEHVEVDLAAEGGGEHVGVGEEQREQPQLELEAIEPGQQQRLQGLDQRVGETAADASTLELHVGIVGLAEKRLVDAELAELVGDDGGADAAALGVVQEMAHQGRLARTVGPEDAPVLTPVQGNVQAAAQNTSSDVPPNADGLRDGDSLGGGTCKRDSNRFVPPKPPVFGPRP